VQFEQWRIKGAECPRWKSAGGGKNGSDKEPSGILQLLGAAKLQSTLGADNPCLGTAEFEQMFDAYFRLEVQKESQPAADVTATPTNHPITTLTGTALMLQTAA